MTDQQLRQFQQLLDTARRELQTTLDNSADSASAVSPDNAIGRLTRQDAMQAQQMTLEIRRRNELTLRQIDAAMLRIEQGGYGICVRCEDEISPARLRVRPETLLCVRCAEAKRN